MLQDERTKAEKLVGLLGIDGYMQQELAANPPPAMRQNAEPPRPKSMLEQMDERHGKLQSRLGLFSHLYNGGSRSDYGDEDMLAARKRRQEQAAMQQKMEMGQPYFEMLQSGNKQDQMKAMFALEQLGFSDSMMELGMPELTPASELPDATRAVIHYQDSLNRYVDPETGEIKMRQMGEDGYVPYNEAYDQYKNREIGALQDQAAAKASGASAGAHEQEIINKAPSEAATMNSAMNSITNMGNITYDDQGQPVFTPKAEYAEDFDDVFGPIDRFKPVGINSGESFVRATIEQLQGILAVEARGKLKGQGQISDSETAMLEKSLTILKSRGISEEQAKREIARIYHVMEKGMRQKEQITSGNQGGQSQPQPGAWDGKRTTFTGMDSNEFTSIYDSMPPGTEYVGPDGKRRTKK